MVDVPGTRGTLDQRRRKTELSPQTRFFPRHLSRIGLMIVAGQVQQSVKDEDLDFSCQRMPLLRGLATRSWHADGKVAGELSYAPFARHIRIGGK